MRFKQWVTIKEAQKITGLSRPTIQDYIKKGILDSKRAGASTRPIYIDIISIPTYLRKHPIEQAVNSLLDKETK